MVKEPKTGQIVSYVVPDTFEVHNARILDVNGDVIRIGTTMPLYTSGSPIPEHEVDVKDLYPDELTAIMASNELDNDAYRTHAKQEETI